MQLKSQHTVINNTIDTIVTKGAQKLYQFYIKQKIPNHTFQQTSSIIQTNFNLIYNNAEKVENIKREAMPKGGLKEVVLPNKIVREKISGSTMGVRTNLSFVVDQTDKDQNNKGSKTQRPIIKKVSSRIRQKIIPNFKPIQNPQQSISQKHQQLQVRKQKNKQFKEKQKIKQQELKIQNQKSIYRKNLQDKLQQLAILGIPYSYDNQGNITTPDLTQYKYQKYQNQKAARQNRSFNLKYKTIDLGSFQGYFKDIKTVSGRKRGYFSSQFYKKLKMSNQQYNNRNGRQKTIIPYLNVVQGIKITQRQRNVIAQKMPSPTICLSEFKQKTQQKFFKSFIPEFQLNNSMQTMIVDRPFTTADYNRTKGTPQTGASLRKMKASILWRPQTTSKECRMSINNQGLAKQVMEIEG